jgi:hypothetical protein
VKGHSLVLLTGAESFLTLPENPWKNVVSSGKVVTVSWAAAAVCPDLLNGNGDNGSYI